MELVTSLDYGINIHNNRTFSQKIKLMNQPHKLYCVTNKEVFKRYYGLNTHFLPGGMDKEFNNLR